MFPVPQPKLKLPWEVGPTAVIKLLSRLRAFIIFARGFDEKSFGNLVSDID